MDFSFLRNWFSTIGAATGSEPGNTEQLDSISVDDGKYGMKDMTMNLRSLKIMNL